MLKVTGTATQPDCVVECSGGHGEHLLLEEQINGAYCCPVHCVSGHQRPLHEIF